MLQHRHHHHRQHTKRSCHMYPGQSTTSNCGDITMFELNQQQPKIFNTLKSTGIVVCDSNSRDDVGIRLNDKCLTICNKHLDNSPDTTTDQQHHVLFNGNSNEKMILINRIRDYIKQGMTAYEEDINTRREKLRAMIQAEETELTRELVNQAHRWYTNSITVGELRKDIDEQREVTEKEVMQKQNVPATVAVMKRHYELVERCPEVRDKITREMTRGVKYANLMQILEKSSRLKEQQELDTWWHGIMLKNSEILRRREEEEIRKRKGADKDTSRILVEQMAGRCYSEADEARREREEARQYHERLRLELEAEQMRNIAREKTKREQLKRDLDKQVMLVRRRCDESARQESEISHKLKVENRAQLAREKVQAVKAVENLRCEMSAYMKNLGEFKANECNMMAEDEAVIDQLGDSLLTKQDLAIKKQRDDKRRKFEKFIAERDSQLKIKREIEAMEMKKIKDEQEINKKDAEVDAVVCIAEAARRREMALRYRLELQAQLENERMTKRREVNEHEEKHHSAMKQDDEYEKLTQELLSAPEIITPSALKIMQEKCDISKRRK